MNQADLDNNFVHHDPDAAKIELHAQVRDWGKGFAEFLLNNMVDCRESALAITKIEEAIFWANAGIARH